MFSIPTCLSSKTQICIALIKKIEVSVTAQQIVIDALRIKYSQRPNATKLFSVIRRVNGLLPRLDWTYCGAGLEVQHLDTGLREDKTTCFSNVRMRMMASQGRWEARSLRSAGGSHYHATHAAVIYTSEYIYDVISARCRDIAHTCILVWLVVCLVFPSVGLGSKAHIMLVGSGDLQYIVLLMHYVTHRVYDVIRLCKISTIKDLFKHSPLKWVRHQNHKM